MIYKKNSRFEKCMLFFRRLYKSRQNSTIILYSFFLFSSGVVFHKTGIIGDFLIPNISFYKNYIYNSFNSFMVSNETLYIDIKHKDFERLVRKRDQALKLGKLIANDDDYVPGKLKNKEKLVKIDIRLKGDWANQFEGSKWSFRIKVKNGDRLFGMRKFSLHHPKERNFIWEYIYHKMLQAEGLISLRYEFVQIILNGKNLGIYALEEHFTKYLIENNQRREGPIIKFSETGYWVSNLYSGRSHDEESYQTANIETFESNYINENPLLYEQYKLGIGLLSGFRDNAISTSKVFDINKLSKFLAISDLMGARHGNRWHNKRFYLNPLTRKLEPIGYDGMAGNKIYSLLMHSENLNKIHQNSIFSDKSLLEQYIFDLKLVSSKDYIDKFFINHRKEIDRALKILYKEFPNYKFEESLLYYNGKRIRGYLNPKIDLEAYLIKKNDDSLHIKLINKLTMPVVIDKITHNNNIIFESDTIINPKILSQKLEPFKLTLFLDDIQGYSIEKVKIIYSILGLENNKTINVSRVDSFNGYLGNEFFIKKSNIFYNKNFVWIDSINQEIRLLPGYHKVTKDVIIPEGFKFVSNGGSTLDLLDSSKIISYSPISFMGSENNKIEVISSDTTGEGFTVLNAKTESIFEYVNFINLKSFNEYGRHLTGSVTIYESDVYFNHCIFENNKSEDALNSFNNNIILKNTLFLNNASDDFDGDFVKGVINKSKFYNSQNDAIDISGSDMNIMNVEINKFGDKGLSLGENSSAYLYNLIISNGEIGVACKDYSKLNGEKIKIDNCNVGITSFQKKSEYGPSIIKINDTFTYNCFEPLLIEAASEVYINGKYIKPNKVDVKNILYGNLYGKKSN